MSKLQWTDNLSVGIDLIDSQHKQWIDRFNRAAEAVAEKLGMTQVASTLDFLVDYTEVHFSTEEKHMTANQYDGLAEHKAKHDELRATLADLVRDFKEEGVSQSLVDALDTMLGAWLVQHIQDVDQKFGAFVKAEGITLAEE